MSKSIQEELNQIISDFATKSISNEPLSTEPTVQVTTEPTTVVEPGKTEPVTPAPTTTQVAPVTPESTVIDDWDGDVKVVEPVAAQPQTPVVPAPQFDFSEVAKVLGKESIKTVDEVVKTVSELKQAADSLSTIPEPLQKAIDIARSNGDYLQYLGVSVIDWGKEDPVVLYENYIEDQFYDPKTGVVDYEKVENILDKLDDDEKELRGKELQKAYVAHQKTQKEMIEQQTRQARTQFESEVKRTIETLTDVNGYKLTPTHKAELTSFILSGEDLKESSVQTRVMHAFVKKYFNALDSYNKTKIKNATKREILQEAQVTSITPSTEVTPSGTSNKGYDIGNWLDDLKKQKGFN